MTHVKFITQGDFDPKVLGRVQVDIFDEHLTRVARSRIEDGVSLSEGLYAARAILPDGACVGSAVFVPKDGEVEIMLAPLTIAKRQSQQRSARESLLDRLRGLELSDFSDLGAGVGHTLEYWGRQNKFPNVPVGRTRVRVLAGNPFDADPVPGPSLGFYGVDDTFIVEAHDKQTFLQLKDPTWRLVVPVSPGGENRTAGRIQVRMVERAGKAFPHFVFENPDLELLVLYAGAGIAGPIAELAQSDASVLARRAFSESPPRPFSAVAGAYAMLRLGDDEKLRPWAGALAETFGWLADAAIIHGEVLARSGDHELALFNFMQIPKRGLPYVSSGLSLVLNRFHQYEIAAEANRLALPADFARVKAQLSGLASVTDFSLPLLTHRPVTLKEGTHATP